jgi:hypothetical protein
MVLMPFSAVSRALQRDLWGARQRRMALGASVSGMFYRSGEGNIRVMVYDLGVFNISAYNAL